MKHTLKGFAFLPVILIVAAVLAVGGGSAYYYSAIKDQPSQNQVATHTESSLDTQATISRNDLIGIWQTSTVMAAGWSTRYQFFPSDTYNYFISQEACDTREKGESGYWEIIDGNLVLKPVIKHTITGGTVVSNNLCGSGKSIKGGVETQTKIIPPQPKTLTLVQCPNSEGSNYPCISLNTKKFYKFGDDPMYMSLEDSLAPEPTFKDEQSGLTSEPFMWYGTYKLSETASISNGLNQRWQFWEYRLQISSSNGASRWIVTLNIDGFQTLLRINATANVRGNALDVVFDSYGSGSMVRNFNKGDVLFTLTPIENGLAVEWKKMQSNVLNNTNSSIFYKMTDQASIAQVSQTDIFKLVSTTEDHDRGVEIIVTEYNKDDIVTSDKILNASLGSYNRTGWSIEKIAVDGGAAIYQVLSPPDHHDDDIAFWHSGKYLLLLRATNLFVDGSEKEQVLEDYLVKYPSTVSR